MNNRKPLGQTEYIQPKSPLGRYQENDGERFPLGVMENTLSSTFPVFHLALKEQDQLESSSWNENFWYDFEPSSPTEQNDSGPSSTMDEIPDRPTTNPIPEKSESTTFSDIQAFTQQLNPNDGAVVSEIASTASSLDISQVTENVNNLSPSQPRIQAQTSLTAEVGKTSVPEPPIADSAPVLTSQGSSIQLADVLEPNTEAFDEAIASQPVVREPDTASNISEPPVQPVQAEQTTKLNLSSENHVSSTDSNVSSEESSTIQRIKDNLLTSDPTDLLSSTNTQPTAEARESSTEQIIETTQLNVNTVQSLPSEAYNLANTEINLTPDERDEVNLSENIQLKANISLAPNPEVLTSQPSENPEVDQNIAKPSLRPSKLSDHEQNLNEKVDSAEIPEVQLRNIISSEALSPELSSPAPPNHHLENQTISQSFASPNRNILGVPDFSSDLLAKPLDESTELIPISNAPSEPQAVQLSLTPLAGILDLPQLEAATELTTKNIHRIDCEENNTIAETTSIQEQSPTKLTLNSLLQTMEKSDRTVTNTPVADIQSSDADSSQGLSEQNLDENLLEQLALKIPEIDSSRKSAKTYESIFEERSEDNSAPDSEADLPLLVKLKQFSELKTLVHPPLIPAFLESTIKPTDGGLANSNFNRDNSPATSDRPNVLNTPNNAITDQPEEFPESWSSLDELVKGFSKGTTENSWQEMIASLTSLQVNSTEDKDKFPDPETHDPETLEEQLPSSDPFKTFTSVINQKHSPSTTIEPLSTKLSSLTEVLTSNTTQKVTDEDLERIAQVVYPWIQQQLIYEQERLLGQGSDFPLWSKIIPNMQAKSPLQSRDSPKIIEPQILMDSKLASLSNEIYALLRSRLALERERIGQNHHRN
jgi:hypothetical protein